MSRVIDWMQVPRDRSVTRPDRALGWANVDDELHTGQQGATL